MHHAAPACCPRGSSIPSAFAGEDAPRQPRVAARARAHGSHPEAAADTLCMAVTRRVTHRRDTVHVGTSPPPPYSAGLTADAGVCRRPTNRPVRQARLSVVAARGRGRGNSDIGDVDEGMGGQVMQQLTKQRQRTARRDAKESPAGECGPADPPQGSTEAELCGARGGSLPSPNSAALTSQASCLRLTRAPEPLTATQGLTPTQPLRKVHEARSRRKPPVRCGEPA